MNATIEVMKERLRTYVAGDTPDLRANQSETLKAASVFLDADTGTEVSFPPTLADPEGYNIEKKGNFLEVVSATGSGKTRTFGTMVREMNEPALILTPRQLLNDQTMREFAKEIGIDKNDIMVYDGNNPRREAMLLRQPPYKVVIATYDSLKKLITEDGHGLDFTNPDDPHYRPLIVLDEVHEAQGLQRAELIRNNFIGNENVVVAGFTATDGGAAQSLFRDQTPVYRLPLVTAIEEGLLCSKVKTGIIDVIPDNTEVWERLKSTGESAEYNQHDIDIFAMDAATINGTVGHHFTHHDEEIGALHDKPTIFFTQGVRGAEKGAAAFNRAARAAGLPARAAFVSGSRSKFITDDGVEITDRNEIIRLFKAGEIKALWNDSLLKMGFDYPNNTIIYSLRNSRSPSSVEQELGRDTRKPDENYAETYGHDKVALAFNVRARDTQSYLYAHVLGGKAQVQSKQYRPPQSHSRTESTSQPARISQLPEEMRAAIENTRTYTHYEEVTSIASATAPARAKTREPLTGDEQYATGEWLTMQDMIDRVGGRRRAIEDAYRRLEYRWERANRGNFTTGAFGAPREISSDQVSMRQTPRSREPQFCVHESLAFAFERADPQEQVGYLQGSDMAERTGQPKSRISAIYKILKSVHDYRRESPDYFDAFGMRFPETAVFTPPETAIGKDRNIFLVHESYAENLIFPDKTPELLKWDEMRTLMSTRDGNRPRLQDDIRTAYQELEENWQQAKINGDETFTVNDISFRTEHLGFFASGAAALNFCINEPQEREQIRALVASMAQRRETQIEAGEQREHGGRSAGAERAENRGREER